MKPILVLYATREGHTRLIAEHLVSHIHARQLAADMVNAAQLPDDFALARYSAAFVCASVHAGKHEPEMTRFVKRHVEQLASMVTVFLSVSLSEAGAEDATAPMEKREQSLDDAEKMIDGFLAETGWRPTAVKPVAGALMYSQYSFPMRLVMKWIAWRAGGDTDTSRDHVYTDWQALDRLANEALGQIAQSTPAAG